MEKNKINEYENYSRDELLEEIKRKNIQLKEGEQKFYELHNTIRDLREQIDFLRDVILKLIK